MTPTCPACKRYIGLHNKQGELVGTELHYVRKEDQAKHLADLMWRIETGYSCNKTRRGNMKVKVKTAEEAFKPFTVEITFETEKDLSEYIKMHNSYHDNAHYDCIYHDDKLKFSNNILAQAIKFRKDAN